MTVHQIRGKLMSKGHSFSSFAKKNGFERRTVSQVVHRWAGKTGQPRGLTKDILDQLSLFIGMQIYRSRR